MFTKYLNEIKDLSAFDKKDILNEKFLITKKTKYGNLLCSS